MSRRLEPDQSDENIRIGRMIHENHYNRERKEVAIGNSKVDVADLNDGIMRISEVKKSSKYLDASLIQLKYYMMLFSDAGAIVSGEIRIPAERKKLKVELSDSDRTHIREKIDEIGRTVRNLKPPPALKIPFCRKCAYSELCWS